MGTVTPRAVLVTRPTEYERLLADHGTHGQAGFFLSSRGQDIAAVQAAHERVVRTVDALRAGVPAEWRRTRVDRSDLARFLFEPEDVVLVIGQDGLVANVAKYLRGQPVLGVNPDPERFEGVLVPLGGEQAVRLLVPASRGEVQVQERALVEAELDDGQRLRGLNEVFLGHVSHQSARYELRVGDQPFERQSSSGVIVLTGSGATGWGRSIRLAHRSGMELPGPASDGLGWFVREAFPSRWTGVNFVEGLLAAGQGLTITSRMDGGGTIFADGIEADRLAFDWGMSATVTLSPLRLRLVLPQ